MDLAVQPNGKAVAISCNAKPLGPNLCRQFLLTRFNVDGSLDRSFGEQGVARSAFADPAAPAAIAVAPDGKLVVSGSTGLKGLTYTNFAVARFNGDGSLDTSFAENGHLVQDFGGDEAAMGGGLAIQADGRIVVSVFGLGVVRYLADGSLDPSFSEDGVAAAGGAPGPLLLRAGGEIVVAVLDGWEARLEQLTVDGERDPSFGDNGQSPPTPAQLEHVGGVAIQRDGKILLGGSTPAGIHQPSVGMLARYTSDGELDQSFLPPGLPAIREIVVASDGTVFLTGRSYGTELDNFVVGAVTPGGALDPAFGLGGALETDFEGAHDSAHPLALTPAGRLLVGGQAVVRSVSGRQHERLYATDLALALYELAQGPPDADGDGKLDRRDRCDFAVSDSRSGCPTHRRRLTIGYSVQERVFVGRVASGYVGCLFGIPDFRDDKPVVRLIERRPGPDRALGSDRVRYDDVGTYEIKERPGSGSFYARVERQADPEHGRCPAAQSRILTLR